MPSLPHPWSPLRSYTCESPPMTTHESSRRGDKTALTRKKGTDVTQDGTVRSPRASPRVAVSSRGMRFRSAAAPRTGPQPRGRDASRRVKPGSFPALAPTVRHTPCPAAR
ncbi:hypothetical protein STRIP9103_02747 [Streptomyces ipomoeae 91-03]|uniref:Uncharacterized protein n=1 Tax=Streptomyces ipomoeae 91-03 TaxID=698759 RepID=L1KRF6_9ACTN|nr:hypothetical protein STRIP9103_02747 [Streptomyces ipomoeae 91-03]